MALSRIQTAEIVDNAVTTGKVDDATVIGTDIVDGTITNTMVASGAAIAHTKCAVGPVASLNVGTGANQILQLDGSGNLPVLDGTQLTGIVSDFTPLENQMARLGLHLGAVGQLTKYNMIDQVIDDYEDATGVVAYNGAAAVPAVGAYQDASGSGHTITENGTATLSTTQKKFGTHSLKFDGGSNSGYYSIPDSTDWDVQTSGANPHASPNGSYTVEFWMYQTAWPSDYCHMIGMATQTFNWSIYQNAANKRMIVGWIGNWAIDWADNKLVLNQWQHIAIVKDVANTYCYIDGVEAGLHGSSAARTANVWSYNSTGTGTGGMLIGGGGIWTAKPTVAGYLDEIRISNVARYTSNFTAPTAAFTSDANTVLLIHGEAQATIPAVPNTGSSSSATAAGSAGAKYYKGKAATAAVSAVAQGEDHSSSGRTVTFTNAVVSTTQKHFGTHSIYFDGSGDYLSVPAHTDFNFSGDFTFECWVYWNGASGELCNIDAGGGGGSRDFRVFFEGTKFKVVMQDIGGNDYLDNASIVSANTWTHVAVVRSGNTLTGYGNGVAMNNPITTNSNAIAGTSTLHIGGPGDTHYNGYMDEIRLSNTARYTSAFTPSTTEFVPDSNTLLLLHGNAVAAVAAVTASDSISLISTTTTAESTSTKASIVLQTEDATGTATVNTHLKAGVSRDALNYVDTTLAKIGTWGSGNVYAANDVTMPGLVMTKVITVPTIGDTDITLDSSNYSTYVKTRANDGIVLRYGDYDYSGGAASDEITVDYGPIVDGDFWGTQASSGLWATHSLQPNQTNIIHVFKSGVTFKPNGTQVSAWMDGANLQTNYRLMGVDSSFNGTQLVQWSATTVTNNQLYTGTTSNSTFYPAFSITHSSANGGNSCSHNRMSFAGTVRSTIPAKYVIDGVSQDTLTLTEGYTYRFDTSDSTNASHHFKFATAADAAGSTQYTTGVTYNGTPGSAGAYTQIVVGASTPTLYYYCHYHASMGGLANTPAEAATTSMRYRIDTKNQSGSKITRVHGTSLAWS